MIELKNVHFAYKNKAVLNGINLKFEKGKFYGIIGPNGSGKSTLLKLISKGISPYLGEILINGKNTADFKGKELAKLLGVMPQSRHIPDMTVYDFVACGRFPYRSFGGKLSDRDNNIINKALTCTNTKDFENINLKSLSGGECQRVFFAQLLAQDTDCMLCDEPTTFLDISAENEILNFLKSQAEEKCVVAVLHNIPLALKYCDRLAVLESGKIADFGSSEELIKSKILDRVFGAACHSVLINGDENFIFTK